MNALRLLRSEQKPPTVDPAARQPLKHRGDTQTGIGWVAAIALHGTLLALVIFTWAASPSLAPQDQKPVSLMLEPPPSSISTTASSTIASSAPLPPSEIQSASVSEAATAPAAPTIDIATILPMPPPAPPAKIPATKHRAPKSPSSLQTQTPTAYKTVVATEITGSNVIPAEPVAGSFNQPPDYPAEAQLHREQGKVLLSVHVNPDGLPDDVSVDRSSGFTILDEAAVAAVTKWHFLPGYKAGRAVSSIVPYWISFVLH